MICSSAFVLLLTFATIVSGGGHETPQYVVTRYNKYKTICTRLGYQNLQCKAGNDGGEIFTMFHCLHVHYQTVYFFILFDNVLAKKSCLIFESLKYHETVIYNKVTLNEGKAYNKDTGKFTATVGGVYAFSWKTLSSPGKYFISEIVHNGNVIADSQCDGRGQSTSK